MDHARAAAKMKTTATVTLLLTFLIAVGCSSAERNAKSGGRLYACKLDVLEVSLGDAKTVIGQKLFRQAIAYNASNAYASTSTSTNEASIAEMLSLFRDGVNDVYDVYGVYELKELRELNLNHVRAKGTFACDTACATSKVTIIGKVIGKVCEQSYSTNLNLNLSYSNDLSIVTNKYNELENVLEKYVVIEAKYMNPGGCQPLVFLSHVYYVESLTPEERQQEIMKLAHAAFASEEKKTD